MSANALLAVLNGCYTRAELDRLLADQPCRAADTPAADRTN